MLLADDLFDSIKEHASKLFTTVKPIAREAIKKFYPQVLGVFDSIVGSGDNLTEFRIKKRYMLTPVVISSATTVTAIPANPGLLAFG
jgi:hypothetical protein